jgi:MoxR-like ATPase
MSNEPKNFLEVSRYAGKGLVLPARDGLPATHHCHDESSLHAINAALASGRPLLVRGDPGTGKSQLARAAAELLEREFVWRVVDAQTQIADLFYSFDAVERLAQAQVAGALAGVASKGRTLEDILDERNFVRPGPLWWAFDAPGARVQQQRHERRCHTTSDAVPVRADANRGFVVLIDEIDKTDPSVPNGLLEALGQGTFQIPGGNVSLHDAGPAPLIVITTNEERELPSAFVRRCLVLHLQLPRPSAGLDAWLIGRGRTHFPELSDTLRIRAAELLIRARVRARELGLSPPGQAEYLDLLRAARDLGKTDQERLTLLEVIKDFALKKHPALHDDPVGAE